jgi:hypothetical protein
MTGTKTVTVKGPDICPPVAAQHVALGKSESFVSERQVLSLRHAVANYTDFPPSLFPSGARGVSDPRLARRHDLCGVDRSRSGRPPFQYD